jgi:Family of unknown function (DUF5995)
MPMRSGTTQHLAEIVQEPVTSIPEVAKRLGEIHDYALRTTTAGDHDGIVCFTSLYKTITETVNDVRYEDRDFLVRLDLEFARRYFDALGRYAADRATAPGPWRILFDTRSHPDIERVQFAAAGVNAHVNYDLAAALLATWQDFPPNDARRRDYEKVNGVFRQHMDELRNRFDAPFGSTAEDRSTLDRLSNLICDLLVRGCRDEAWDDAADVWRSRDRDAARARMLRHLDGGVTLLGRALLLPLP